MGSRISGRLFFSDICSSGAMRWSRLLSSKKQKPGNSNSVLDQWLQTGQQHIHLEIKLEDLGITATVYHWIYLKSGVPERQVQNLLTCVLC